MYKKLSALALSVVLVITSTTSAFAATDAKAPEQRKVRIQFTSDMHSYLDVTRGNVNGEIREHGGVSRLATLLRKHAGEVDYDSIYLDGGDFSQGTLFQAGYRSEATELKMLGELGCTAATIGNHEWDLAGQGFADMLKTAISKSDYLPPLLCANLDFSGELTGQQNYVANTLKKYIEKSGQDHIGNTIIETKEGIKIGLFGISGEESIADSPTSGMKWRDGIEAATEQVEYLKDKCDMIVCISHSGVDPVEEGEEQTGEDIELAKAYPDIDLIISGHSHSFLFEPVMVGDTLVVASGEYLDYMGYVDASIAEDGSVTFDNYALDIIDDTVDKDPVIQAAVDSYRARIDKEYVSKWNLQMDWVIAHCGWDFVSLADMYATHKEYPMGDLIADSYLYEANKNGIHDIDVALVGLGTIRGSLTEGDVTVADAFEICSLGAGKDNSSGHPLVSAYITGAELKLLTELDASLGPLVSSIKMSYSGLEYSWNTKRALLDRVTSVHLVRPDGTREKIYDDKMYKVCCNMYAANMLGMLNSLTRGILKIVPKFKDGTPVENFYDCELVDKEGREMKEWYAFADYLSSFATNDQNVPEISSAYVSTQGRKVKYEKSGLAAIENPGATTIASMVGVVILIVLLMLINRKVRRKRKKRKNKEIEQEDK